uniref:Uncharacterized protein n=1 Tax=Noctiluca scintillans TaxID=2966 RepID=A0A7S1EWB8_NOCSC|mmetsp:Transcript_12533/g.34639  ORF Transcript_12533/g.34639 Transcript_12533/m.34639 type:complete len:104 (+) Transcript_12533:39-350(+)
MALAAAGAVCAWTPCAGVVATATASVGAPLAFVALSAAVTVGVAGRAYNHLRSTDDAEEEIIDDTENHPECISTMVFAPPAAMKPTSPSDGSSALPAKAQHFL